MKGPEHLTSAQKRVLIYLAQGLNIHEIAKKHHCSNKVVEFHRAGIKKILGLKTLAEMVHYAIFTKLIPLKEFVIDALPVSPKLPPRWRWTENAEIQPPEWWFKRQYKYKDPNAVRTRRVVKKTPPKPVIPLSKIHLKKEERRSPSVNVIADILATTGTPRFGLKPKVERPVIKAPKIKPVYKKFVWNP